MPIDYKKYPSNWKTEIRPAILERANHKCEFCGVANYAIGFRDEFGAFHQIENSIALEAYEFPSKPFKIILTIAHLDHDIKNNDYSNLKALCQKCHNNYDAPYRAQNRRESLKWKKKQLELPLNLFNHVDKN